MKQLFYIENNKNANGQQVLSLRLGEKHGSFVISSKSGSELYSLAYCIADEWNENELTNFHTAYPLLDNPFYHVQVAFDFPQSVLISSKEFKQEDARLLLSASGYKTDDANIISELISERQLYIIYAVPTAIQEWVNSKFPTANFRHQYSLGIKNIDSADAGSLTVDFQKDNFTVIAAKGIHFLLAQTFEYVTPADVLYYLLKICQQFSLSQQELQLQLSGLIDKQSSLYNELYQYFINIEFRDANWKMTNDYPAHFFTSLNDLARCES